MSNNIKSRLRKRSSKPPSPVNRVTQSHSSPDFPAPSATSFTLVSQTRIDFLPPGSKLPGLSAAELRLLRKKQKQLAQNAPTTLAELVGSSRKTAHLRNALEASLIFAQYEAGSVVCVAPEGLVLTCAHCFGDIEEERVSSQKKRWLLTVHWSGRAGGMSEAANCAI